MVLRDAPTGSPPHRELLAALEASRGGLPRSVLGALSHREGFLVTPDGGCHIMLVKERDGRRRLLVPEG